MTNPAYVELEARYRRVALLGETSAILHWDTATIMPDGAASARAEQLAEIQVVIHGLKTATEVGDLIGDLIGDAIPMGTAVEEVTSAQRTATAALVLQLD